MRIFKTRWFARFARQEGIGDEKLADAVWEAEKGLNDGDRAEALSRSAWRGRAKAKEAATEQ